MMDWICRNCGKEFNGDFATKWGNCPSLTGCGTLFSLRAIPTLLTEAHIGPTIAILLGTVAPRERTLPRRTGHLTVFKVKLKVCLFKLWV